MEQKDRKKWIWAKLAVKQRLRGPTCVSPQGDSGVADWEEEMPQASEGKPSGGVAQTWAHAVPCSCPCSLAFSWQSAWGNMVDSSVLLLFICPYLRSKC